jgi:LmbE family N-acetylglucosaminyl deacetylase
MAACRRLPLWRSVLAVVAHPDDESFGLGAVLSMFSASARVAVLCFTHGEASTVHGVAGDLRAIREAELSAAARALALDTVTLLDYPDGQLAATASDTLISVVRAAAEATRADGLVVFDPAGVTGHPDHRAATAAAVAAAAELGLPVLAWTLPHAVAQTLNAELGTAFVGHPASAIDLQVPVNRERQHAAVACHPSQAVPTSALWRRLHLLGDTEHLRWVHKTATSQPP